MMALIWLAFSNYDDSYAVEENDQWWDLEQKALEMNEGNLVFLMAQNKDRIHHHHNRVILLPNNFSDE